MNNPTPSEQPSLTDAQSIIDLGVPKEIDDLNSSVRVDHKASIANRKKSVVSIVDAPHEANASKIIELLAELRSFKHFEFDEYADTIAETGNVDSLNNLGDNAFKAISDSCVLIGIRKNADESVFRGIISKAMKKVARIMYIKILILLHECGADVNHRNNNRGVTALDVAVNFNDMVMTKFLLSLGADPNMKIGARGGYGNLGNSPLMIAAINGNAKMVRLLLKYGADVNFFNSKLETAYRLAKPEIKKILKKEKTFDDSKPWLNG